MLPLALLDQAAVVIRTGLVGLVVVLRDLAAPVVLVAVLEDHKERP
jgi:hypothetical protein